MRSRRACRSAPSRWAWSDYGTKPRANALKGVHVFGDEIRTASPRTKVIVPDYFVPMTFK
jgi:hypothetical protein